jgi:hypothetical protein
MTSIELGTRSLGHHMVSPTVFWHSLAEKRGLFFFKRTNLKKNLINYGCKGCKIRI